MITTISSGIKQLDDLLDIGGYPLGRIIEISGDVSVGKTYLSLLSAQSFLKRKKKVLFIDAEYSLSTTFIQNMGLSLTGMCLLTENKIEKIFDIVRNNLNEYDLFILDSLPAILIKEDEFNAYNIIDKYYLAKSMGHFLRSIIRKIYDYNKLFIIINQFRFIRRGLIVHLTPGRNLMRTYAAIRISLFNNGFIIKNVRTRVGHKVLFKIVKNSLGTPNKTMSLNLIYNKGFMVNED